MSNHECIFCHIVAGQAPAQVVLEDQLSLCFLDIAPFTQGHCLVIPKRHVPWWHEMTSQENASLFHLAQRISRRMMAVYKPDFVCLYARGRRIPHTHLFLVPTFSGDVLDSFFNALERFQEAPPKLAGLWDQASLAQAAQALRQAPEKE